MNMTIYFIDFENVHESGLKGLADLPKEDRVHLFYTVNANKISFDFFEIIRNSNIILHKVAAGKQALDMMLSSFLGFCVAGTQGARFVIVSKDRDYAPVVDFWNTQTIPVDVEQYASISAACGVLETETEPVEESEPSYRSRRRGGRSRNMRGRIRSGERAPQGTENVQPAASEEAAVFDEPVKEEVPEVLEVSAEVFEETLAAVYEASEEAAAPEENSGEEAAPEVLEVPAEVFEETLAAVYEAAEAEHAPEAKPEQPKKPARRSDRNRNRKKAQPAEQTESAVSTAEEAEKPAAKPVSDKQRAGQESNAVHNAVQKALSQEKVDTNTIAFLASLTAKNYGKPNDKQTIYRAVIKQYGQKEGLRLYGIMKTCFKG